MLRILRTFQGNHGTTPTISVSSIEMSKTYRSGTSWPGFSALRYLIILLALFIDLDHGTVLTTTLVVTPIAMLGTQPTAYVFRLRMHLILWGSNFLG